jgi:hypothetical protein
LRWLNDTEDALAGIVRCSQSIGGDVFKEEHYTLKLQEEVIYDHEEKSSTFVSYSSG